MRGAYISIVLLAALIVALLGWIFSRESEQPWINAARNAGVCGTAAVGIGLATLAFFLPPLAAQ
jgi:VIT1/CCC1 family predicted Fe2+/Mn2+ transporter